MCSHPDRQGTPVVAEHPHRSRLLPWAFVWLHAGPCVRRRRSASRSRRLVCTRAQCWCGQSHLKMGSVPGRQRRPALTMEAGVLLTDSYTGRTLKKRADRGGPKFAAVILAITVPCSNRSVSHMTRLRRTQVQTTSLQTPMSRSPLSQQQYMGASSPKTTRCMLSSSGSVASSSVGARFGHVTHPTPVDKQMVPRPSGRPGGPRLLCHLGPAVTTKTAVAGLLSSAVSS